MVEGRVRWYMIVQGAGVVQGGTGWVRWYRNGTEVVQRWYKIVREVVKGGIDGMRRVQGG